jgi:predicted RNase H-like HicB family nuclease
MKYRIILEQDEDGIYTAICPALPGCISQGKTRSEALVNIQDAMEGYVASLTKEDEAYFELALKELAEGKTISLEQLKLEIANV